MEPGNFALDVLSQTQRTLSGAVDGLTQKELAYQPGKESNSIGFILWHQVRAEDTMINGMLRKKPQVWETGNWGKKLNMTQDANDDGWGYTAEQVAAFKIPELKGLLDYAEAVRAETVEYLQGVSPESLNEEISAPFGKMPASGVISLMVCELTLHTGQIAYLRGLQRGINK